MRRVHSSPLLPFPFSPPLIPDGRISRVRLAATAFHDAPSAAATGLSARSRTPAVSHVIGLASFRALLYPCFPALNPATVPRVNHCPPRAPLHVCGVPASVLHSRHRSAGVTPPSSLLRAHASNRRPPVGFGFPYSFRSLQVVASPCCTTVFPDVISTFLVRSPGSLPRHDAAVHLSVSSRSTSASPFG